MALARSVASDANAACFVCWVRRPHAAISTHSVAMLEVVTPRNYAEQRLAGWRIALLYGEGRVTWCPCRLRENRPSTEAVQRCGGGHYCALSCSVDVTPLTVS